MSDSNKCSQFSESILRLKSLRDRICTDDDSIKKALEVRHHVIESLKNLQLLLDDSKTEKKECSLKLRSILAYYEENNNV